MKLFGARAEPVPELDAPSQRRQAFEDAFEALVEAERRLAGALRAVLDTEDAIRQAGDDAPRLEEARARLYVRAQRFCGVDTRLERYREVTHDPFPRRVARRRPYPNVDSSQIGPGSGGI